MRKAGGATTPTHRQEPERVDEPADPVEHSGGDESVGYEQ